MSKARPLFTRHHVVSKEPSGRNNNAGEDVEGLADMGNSGIFGYINYLVEKDRKTILDTLVNGRLTRNP